MDRGTATITDIRSPARGSHRRTLVMDGDSSLVLPVEVLRDLDLRVGDEITPSGVADAVSAIAPVRARERALRLLRYRERTCKEVLDRLLDDGYSPDVAQTVVGDLLSSGLIDDERFARDYARVLTAVRSYGRERTSRELARRGIPAERITAVLDEVAPLEAEPERALSRARALVRSGDTAQRLASRLVRRGFSPSVALHAAYDVVRSEGSAAEFDDDR